MAEHHGEGHAAAAAAAAMEKAKAKQREDDDDFSSSDSENERPARPSSSSASVAAAAAAVAGLSAPVAGDKIYRLFGRERPVHHVLGGGAPADVFLWRNKKVSGGVLGGVTGLWVFFDLMEYHLLTLVSHALILALAVLFLYSNASTFINKSPPRLPEVYLPEDITLAVAQAIRQEINRGLFFVREIASGRDLKKFLAVITGLWVLSTIGGCCSFLSLIYIVSVLMFTVPVLYEKFEDKVDAFAEKAAAETKKHYAVFDEKVLSQVLSKIPRGPLKDKKQH